MQNKKEEEQKARHHRCGLNKPLPLSPFPAPTLSCERQSSSAGAIALEMNVKEGGYKVTVSSFLHAFSFVRFVLLSF